MSYPHRLKNSFEEEECLIFGDTCRFQGAHGKEEPSFLPREVDWVCWYYIMICVHLESSRRGGLPALRCACWPSKVCVWPSERDILTIDFQFLMSSTSVTVPHLMTSWWDAEIQLKLLMKGRNEFLTLMYALSSIGNNAIPFSSAGECCFLIANLDCFLDFTIERLNLWHSS